jgi:MinD-like ATPase involved in chromosome partitioning or flagellar assembly
MEGTRAPQGLDAEDRIALGLGATHLFYLVVCSMMGWALLTSHLPAWLRWPTGLSLIGLGALLAWGRVAGRTADRWAWLYLAYRLRPTRSDADVAPPTPPAADLLAGGRLTAAPTTVLKPATAGAPAVFRGNGTRYRRARRCAFYSSIGGSGKSILAFEVASLVASTTTARVALLDLAGESTTMRVRTGLDGPGLQDLLDSAVDPDPASIERALLRHPGGVRVLLAAGAAGRSQDPLKLERCVERVFSHLDAVGVDLVVVDVDSVTSDSTRRLLARMDAVYCLFTPTPTGVFGLYRDVAALRRIGVRREIRAVLNRHDVALDLDEVMGDLRVDLVTTIPTLGGLMVAEDRHAAACLDDATVMEALCPLAEDAYPGLAAGPLPRLAGNLPAGHALP